MCAKSIGKLNGRNVLLGYRLYSPDDIILDAGTYSTSLLKLKIDRENEEIKLKTWFDEVETKKC